MKLLKEKLLYVENVVRPTTKNVDRKMSYIICVVRDFAAEGAVLVCRDLSAAADLHRASSKAWRRRRSSDGKDRVGYVEKRGTRTRAIRHGFYGKAFPTSRLRRVVLRSANVCMLLLCFDEKRADF